MKTFFSVFPSFDEDEVDYESFSLNETLGLSNIPYKGWYRYFPDEGNPLDSITLYGD